MTTDAAKGNAIFTFDRFEFPESLREQAESFLHNGGSIEEAVSAFGGYLGRTQTTDNVFLNEGIQQIWDHAIGAGGTTYSNANARVGVGESATAESATQTGLQGSTLTFKAMDATYPIRTAQTVDFRGTFGSADANIAWNEFTTDNGVTPNKNIHRKVSAQGTKTSGQTWILTVSLTIT